MLVDCMTNPLFSIIRYLCRSHLRWIYADDYKSHLILKLLISSSSGSRHLSAYVGVTSSSLVVTYPTEGMAAVLPHADEASVCQVCWWTSSTQPFSDDGCNSVLSWRRVWFIKYAANKRRGITDSKHFKQGSDCTVTTVSTRPSLRV